MTVTLTDGFTDVLPGTWYYDYVTDLAGAGVMAGVGNRQFRPEGTMTWGQAMKRLLLAAGYEELSPVNIHTVFYLPCGTSFECYNCKHAFRGKGG